MGTSSAARRRGPSRIVPCRVFDHTADVGLAIAGRTLPELFENAARGLFDLLGPTRGIRRRVRRRVSLASGSREELLRAWLAELLYLSYAKGLVLAHARVDRLGATLVEATVSGERYDPDRHERHPEVKAVTYHGLTVRRVRDHWEARVILDL